MPLVLYKARPPVRPASLVMASTPEGEPSGTYIGGMNCGGDNGRDDSGPPDSALDMAVIPERDPTRPRASTAYSATSASLSARAASSMSALESDSGVASGKPPVTQISPLTPGA